MFAVRDARSLDPVTQTRNLFIGDLQAALDRAVPRGAVREARSASARRSQTQAFSQGLGAFAALPQLFRRDDLGEATKIAILVSWDRSLAPKGDAGLVC